MSYVYTTISIKKSVKNIAEKCKDVDYEPWNVTILKISNFYLENKSKKKSEEE